MAGELGSPDRRSRISRATSLSSGPFGFLIWLVTLVMCGLARRRADRRRGDLPLDRPNPPVAAKQAAALPEEKPTPPCQPPSASSEAESVVQSAPPVSLEKASGQPEDARFDELLSPQLDRPGTDEEQSPDESPPTEHRLPNSDEAEATKAPREVRVSERGHRIASGSPPAGTRHIAPEKRGGRPRGPIDRSGSAGDEPRAGSTRAEVVCWKWGAEWEIGLRLDSEFLDLPGLRVTQGNVPLDRSIDRDGCWVVRDLTQTVEIAWDEDQSEQVRLLVPEGFLLLRLGGEALEWGRQTRCLSKGLHLVVVPEYWQLVRDSAENVQVGVEPISAQGCSAYVVACERDSARMDFRAPGVGALRIGSRPWRFEPDGNLIADASSMAGPLFGPCLPSLRVLGEGIDHAPWSSIGTIVIGEEGGARRRKTTSFHPDPSVTEQTLPAEVAAWGANWLFVRLYDHDDSLVDSLDFRFVPGLRSLIVAAFDFLPDDEGYPPATVTFVHDPGCSVRLAPGAPSEITLLAGIEETVLTLPPIPACDKAPCIVQGSAGGHVRAVARVDRVWWALGEQGSTPCQWTDEVLPVSQGDLAATSLRVLWVRLPVDRWTDRVTLRLGDGRPRHFPVAVGSRFVRIPLADFSDVPEREQPGETPIFLRIRPSATGRASQTVACSLVVLIRCSLCTGFVGVSLDALREHVEQEHLGLFFRPLTYNELRDKMPSLPRQIYRCGYCPSYVPSDDYRNPTSAITRHVEHCPHAERVLDKVRVRFHIVSSVDEIRKWVEDLRNLPRIERCKLCGGNLNEPTPTDKVRHLLEKHSGEVYELI